GRATHRRVDEGQAGADGALRRARLSRRSRRLAQPPARSAGRGHGRAALRRPLRQWARRDDATGDAAVPARAPPRRAAGRAQRARAVGGARRVLRREVRRAPAERAPARAGVRRLVSRVIRSRFDGGGGGGGSLAGCEVTVCGRLLALSRTEAARLCAERGARLVAVPRPSTRVAVVVDRDSAGARRVERLRAEGHPIAAIDEAAF